MGDDRSASHNTSGASPIQRLHRANEALAHDKRRQFVVRILLGLAVTIGGAALLLLAAHLGATVGQFASELGSAVALSGVIWWISRELRGFESKRVTDISALAVVGVGGAAGVWFALNHGVKGADVALTVGAALATLWLFAGLETIFSMPSGGVPFVVRLLSLPLLLILGPIFLLASVLLRDVSAGLGEASRQLSINDLMNESEIDWEISVLDTSDAYDSEAKNAMFDPSASEAAAALQVTFPLGFSDWVTSAQRRAVIWSNESFVRAWPWWGIKEHPVDVASAIVFFADSDRFDNGGYLALDLRDTAKRGSVVRYNLSDGTSLWKIEGEGEQVAASFEAWAKLAAFVDSPSSTPSSER